jgi:hypothetical protein
LVVSALLTVSLFAFSSTASAKTVSPDTWVGRMCKTLSKWDDEVQAEARGTKVQAALSGSAANLDEGKALLTKFLGNVVDVTDVAVTSLQKAGTPDVPNGKKIADRIVGGLKEAKRVFVRAQVRARGLSTSDAAAFKSGATALQVGLSAGSEAISASFSGIKKLDTGGKIAAAGKRSAACASL